MSNQENKTNEGNINAKDFVIGTLIGGIVGAATALLLAPKSGKELRTDLNEQASTIREKSSQWKDTAYEKGTELAAVAREKSSELSKALQEQSTVIADRVKSIRNQEEGLESVEDQEHAEEEVNNSGNNVDAKLEETKQAFDQAEETVK